MGKKTSVICIGDEPLLAGYEINAQWGIAWPKIIARAWLAEKSQDKNEKVWLNNLMSGDPAKVKDAFIQEGFSPSVKVYRNIDLIIEKLTKLNQKMKNCKVKNQHNVDSIKKLIDYFKDSNVDINNAITELEELIDDPQYKDDCEEILKDLITENEYVRDKDWFWENVKIVVKKQSEDAYVKSNDSTKPIVNNSGKHVMNKYEYRPPVVKEIGDIKLETIQNILLYNDYNKDNDKTEIVIKTNGWKDVKNIAPILILTLPPAPNESKDFACAISDYQAAGLVYPFTVFC